MSLESLANKKFININYETIRSIVEEISEIHKYFWNECNEVHNLPFINLKKKQIRNVFDDELKIIRRDFMSLILEYHTLLSKMIIEIELEYEYSDLEFRPRVKQIDSIVNKLAYYRYEKVEEGKVPLNKCLNDLLGFRIMVEGFDHTCKEFDGLCQEMSTIHNIKKENSSKGDYKATHIYFRGEKNLYFPWELQIWDKNDEVQNEASHKEHKRDYTKWPGVYKESLESVGGV